MPGQQTVLCIQDLSCVGRSSLSVVIPTLASMGVQPCALPTALLSSHMGFEHPAVTQESDFIERALSHYDALGITFSCVYSGYLADVRQIDLVRRAFAQSPHALKIVDPVMADHGRPYASMTKPIRDAVASLCSCADLIVPNTTEALLLLGKDPAERAWSDREAKENILGLKELYPALSSAVITGVVRTDGTHCNLCWDGASVHFLTYRNIPQAYPGTGDLFASVLTGALLRGQSLADACRSAAQFVALAVHNTFDAGCEPRFGVRFEPLLSHLASK